MDEYDMIPRYLSGIAFFQQNVMPKCRLYVVGSSLSGFGADCSDVDMCLMLTPYDMDQRTEAINILKYLQCELSNYGKKDFGIIWNTRCCVHKPKIIEISFSVLRYNDSHEEGLCMPSYYSCSSQETAKKGWVCLDKK